MSAATARPAVRKYAVYTFTIEGPESPDDAAAEEAVEAVEACVAMAESGLGSLLVEHLGAGWSVEVTE